MKKTIAAVAIAATLTGFGASAAQAYTAPETATVSDPVVAPGEAFVFSGTGMLPGETVNIVATNETAGASGGGGGAGRLGASIGGSLMAAVVNASTTADENGNFSVTMTLTEPGTYTLTATGATSGEQVTAVVTVVDPATGGGQDADGTDGGLTLADTGSDASLLLWGAAGIGVLGLGAGTVIVARRRGDSAEA